MDQAMILFFIFSLLFGILKMKKIVSIIIHTAYHN